MIKNLISQFKDSREDLPLHIPVSDVLNNLEDYSYGEMSEEKFNRLRESNKIRPCDGRNMSGNTYNWSGRITNDINYELFTTDDAMIIAKIMVHIAGDIRGNYSEYVYLIFRNEYDFFEALSLRDSVDIIIDDARYIVEFSSTYDTLTVYNEEWEEVGEVWSMDMEELESDIRELLKKGE